MNSDQAVQLSSQPSPQPSVPEISTLVRMFLPEGQQRLVTDSQALVRYLAKDNQWNKLEIQDFAFIVFPAAKAYEGFLKEYLYRLGLISENLYSGRYFRIGRSLNPDLPPRLKDEDWLYDDVARSCDAATARVIWQTWLDARNHLFHYYPHDKYELTFPQAVALVEQVFTSMHAALECQPDSVQEKIVQRNTE